jgi:glycerol-3-phosphate acyltransferase PlsY
MPWMEQLRSANWNQASSIAFAAYGLGCITTGYYLVKLWKGVDIRDLGSGSVGAKNVGRTLGWAGFFLTLLGDVSKGAFAVWGARHFTTDERIVAMAMIAVVAGHVWPVQLYFHGGKGIATSLGALLIFDGYLTTAFLILFALAFAFWHKMVLPGLFAFICLPLVSLYHGDDAPKAVLISILAGLVFVAHRKNLMEEFSHFAETRNVEVKNNQHD